MSGEDLNPKDLVMRGEISSNSPPSLDTENPPDTAVPAHKKKSKSKKKSKNNKPRERVVVLPPDIVEMIIKIYMEPHDMSKDLVHALSFDTAGQTRFPQNIHLSPSGSFLPLLLTSKLFLAKSIPLIYSHIVLRSPSEYNNFLTLPNVTSYQHVNKISLLWFAEEGKTLNEKEIIKMEAIGKQTKERVERGMKRRKMRGSWMKGLKEISGSQDWGRFCWRLCWLMNPKNLSISGTVDVPPGVPESYLSTTAKKRSDPTHSFDKVTLYEIHPSKNLKESRSTGYGFNNPLPRIDILEFVLPDYASPSDQETTTPTAAIQEPQYILKYDKYLFHFRRIDLAVRSENVKKVFVRCMDKEWHLFCGLELRHEKIELDRCVGECVWKEGRDGYQDGQKRFRSNFNEDIASFIDSKEYQEYVNIRTDGDFLERYMKYLSSTIHHPSHTANAPSPSGNPVSSSRKCADPGCSASHGNEVEQPTTDAITEVIPRDENEPALDGSAAAGSAPSQQSPKMDPKESLEGAELRSQEKSVDDMIRALRSEVRRLEAMPTDGKVGERKMHSENEVSDLGSGTSSQDQSA